MVFGQLKAITSERMKNIVGTKSFCGKIRPKESVVDYVNAAYSLTNTAELGFCWLTQRFMRVQISHKHI